MKCSGGRALIFSSLHLFLSPLRYARCNAHYTCKLHSCNQIDGKGEQVIVQLASIMAHNAKYWIDHFKLQRLDPEGGYFSETYSSKLVIPKKGLPKRFGTEHAAATAIYYLLQGKEFSTFHRLKSDEIWHFYDGSSVLIHSIDEEGELNTVRLGREAERGDVFQGVMYAGCWFAAQLEDPREGNYALMGCTVAPGFNFKDFELAPQSLLTAKYPQHSDLINKLTRS